MTKSLSCLGILRFDQGMMTRLLSVYHYPLWQGLWTETFVYVYWKVLQLYGCMVASHTTACIQTRYVQSNIHTCSSSHSTAEYVTAQLRSRSTHYFTLFDYSFVVNAPPSTFPLSLTLAVVLLLVLVCRCCCSDYDLVHERAV